MFPRNHQIVWYCCYTPRIHIGIDYLKKKSVFKISDSIAEKCDLNQAKTLSHVQLKRVVIMYQL